MAETIPIRFAQSLLRLAPMPREQLAQELAELDLPRVLLQGNANPDLNLSVEDYGRLFIHLVRRLQPLLPEEAGNPESALLFSAYQMMFTAMLHAPDLRRAMERASVCFQRMQVDGESFYLEPEGDWIRCRFDFSDSSSRELESLENFSMDRLNWLPGETGRLLSMAMWHRVCSWFIGNYIDLQRVQMRQPGKPGQDYRSVFAVPVEFEAPVDAWVFHRRYLEFPIVQSEASLRTMLETYPAELFRLDPADNSVSNRVRQLIGADFQRELPGLPEVAERLHMTTPTLHRRLREEGQSFQRLKDECRRDAAINYLRAGSCTNSQVAELLGFSDSSTFQRAFKKWTGKTPQEFRP